MQKNTSPGRDEVDNTDNISVPFLLHSGNQESPTDTLPLPDFLEKTVEDETAWQQEQLQEQLQEHAANTRQAEWALAKFRRQKYEYEFEPWEASKRYFAEFADFPPDKFKTSKRQRKKAAEKALKPAGYATRLFQQLDHPNTPVYFYTLSITNLGLPVAYADSRFVYIPLVIAEIKAALKRLIPQPFSWKVEVGNEGTVHIHVIGPYAPLLNHLEGSKRMQQVQPGTERRLIAYMCKPPATFTEFNYTTYLEAKRDKQTKNLPQLSGQLGIKKTAPRREKE